MREISHNRKILCKRSILKKLHQLAINSIFKKNQSSHIIWEALLITSNISASEEFILQKCIEFVRKRMVDYLQSYSMSYAKDYGKIASHLHLHDNLFLD